MENKKPTGRTQNQRKLAAIMFTDIVSYTSLTQRNEPLSLELLEEHRRILRPIFVKHNGNEIETIGDAFFVEFDGALNACLCAIEIQQTIFKRNSKETDERKIRLRIGLHIGDVVHMGNNLHGDGVNIAARVHPLAPAGGIVISEDFWRQVKSYPDFSFVSLGARKLKGLNKTLKIFTVNGENIALPNIKQRLISRPSIKKIIRISLIAILLLSVIVVYLFIPSSGRIEASQTIAVLPFIDMSPKKDQEYFSDGLSEELINTLSRNRKLKVIARTSSFYFKKKSVDIKTIALKLNVKHILEGSVRKYGNNLRITADLVNAETNATLWSNTYDAKLGNIFALQDSISGSVMNALNATLLGNETMGPEQKTGAEAYNNYLLGNHFYELRGKDNFERAADYFEKALLFDSTYAAAWLGLSNVHCAQADFGYMPSDEGYRKSSKEAEKSLEINPSLANAYARLAWIKSFYEWDWNRADELIKKALKLEPENAGILNNAASLAYTLGRFNEAIELFYRSIEIDPLRTIQYFDLGIVYLYINSLDKSITSSRKCLEMNPQFPGAHQLVGFAYLFKGNPDSALVEMQKEVEPSLQILGLAFVYYDLGRKKEADNKLADYIKGYQDDSAYQIAEIYAYRNEKNKAFEWLERAYKQHDGGLGNIMGDPLMRNIVKDPRYTEFLEKMKLLL